MLVSGTLAANVPAVDDEPTELLDSRGMSENDREGKFLSVFQIVKFKNGMCRTTTGDYGTCYTEAECKAAGGIPSGPCASSFGVCCLFICNACGSVVNQNNTYIQNVNYPSAAPAGMCMYEIQKCSSDICQYRFVFEDVVLSDPMMGDCTNDTMMFTGLDPPSMATVPPSLCGTLSGQEMYVWVKNQDAGSKVVFNIASMASMSRYKIRVEQLECGPMNAPPGCLTYNMGISGSITSYNFNGGSGEMINNQKFSHCIKYQEGYCDIAMTCTKFDVGNDPGDSVTIGSNVLQGMNFGTNNMLNVNFTGPYTFPVCTDDMNTQMSMGYDIAYMLVPCA